MDRQSKRRDAELDRHKLHAHHELLHVYFCAHLGWGPNPGKSAVCFEEPPGTVSEAESTEGLRFCRPENRLVPDVCLAMTKPSRWMKAANLPQGFAVKGFRVNSPADLKTIPHDARAFAQFTAIQPNQLLSSPSFNATGIAIAVAMMSVRTSGLESIASNPL